MDGLLTDLDALTLTVRNPLARGYIDESVRAYRAGSYKAAIVSIWVAVTFDILAKIRELSEMGDAAATTHISAFDSHVQTRNVQKLLQIENALLDDAELRFSFLDPIARRHFDRLKEDRNLCAHPAFTMDGQLFAPEAELVRLYIVEAIRNLLAQRPVQGKTVINQFDADFKSTAFPAGDEQITRFVSARYLQNLRPNVLAAFTTVLVKALLRQVPSGWAPRLSLLPVVLQAVKQHDPIQWSATTVPQIVGLIEAADDDHLPNAYALLAAFSELRGALSVSAAARLLAFIENMVPDASDVRAYQAAAVPDFAAATQASFEAADRHNQVAVVLRFPYPAFWPGVLKRLQGSGSWRSAENNLSGLILPFGSSATPAQLKELLSVVASSSEIWWASGTPERLLQFVSGIVQRHQLSQDDVADFVAFLDEHDRRSGYDDVLSLFNKAGVVIPDAPVRQP